MRAQRRLAIANHRAGFVNILEGIYSFGEELYTNGLTGCEVALLYLEFEDGRKQGILSHYPAILTPAHIQRLQELREENIKQPPSYERGVILTKHRCRKTDELSAAISLLFPKIYLETRLYDPLLIGDVILSPSQSDWTSTQFSTRHLHS